jgi:MFS family permease
MKEKDPMATETKATIDTHRSLPSDPHKMPIPQTVWILGSIMFLINLSFVMIYSFSGLYLKNFLGVANIWIGLLEGIAEALSFAMKLVSGIVTDYLRKRRPVMIVGYALSVLARPLLAMAGSFSMVLTARIIERIGNGIQASPRDAIVADVTPPQRIGASYGLKRSLGTAGSFFGAVCGALAMWATCDNFQAVFWLASIPAVIALVLLIIFVKEPKQFEHQAVSAEVPLPAPKRRHRLQWSNVRLLGTSFWILMIINGIFMLARMGEQFLILHAHVNFGLEMRYAPLIMMLFNAGWCATSYPVGVLADRMNRYWFLAVGMIFLILADLTLATAANLWIILTGVLFWGFQYGITQNIFTSLIAETVPEDLRGTGFGCYYIISALSIIIAESAAGKLADNFGYNSAFIFSGVIGIFALLVLIIIMGYRSSYRK